MTQTLTPGGRGLGHVPDAPDDRDHLYAVPDAVPHQFVDLEDDPAMPPVWDQEQLGSCVPHGTIAAVLFAAAKAGVVVPMLSRLQLYFLGRLLEGTVNEDSGLQIRDGIKVAAAGLAPETDWPYEISKFTETPPAKATEDATNRALTYASVETSRAAIQACLSEGFPVVNGLTLFPSFESDEAISTGVVKHPKRGEQEIGGHCQLIVGIGYGHEWKAAGQYPASADRHLYVKVRNSWGPDVFQRGYELMGVPYQSRYGNDFWTVRSAN